jgi:hypothetical protein
MPRAAGRRRSSRRDRGWRVQISRIERGAREVRLTTTVRLWAAFDLEPNPLLAGLDR